MERGRQNVEITARSIRGVAAQTEGAPPARSPLGCDPNFVIIIEEKAGRRILGVDDCLLGHRRVRFSYNEMLGDCAGKFHQWNLPLPLAKQCCFVMCLSPERPTASVSMMDVSSAVVRLRG